MQKKINRADFLDNVRNRMSAYFERQEEAERLNRQGEEGFSGSPEDFLQEGSSEKLMLIFYTCFTDEIYENIKNNVKVALPELGAFYAQVHRGHPVPSSSGENIVPDYVAVKFTASGHFKDKLRSELEEDARLKKLFFKSGKGGR